MLKGTGSDLLQDEMEGNDMNRKEFVAASGAMTMAVGAAAGRADAAGKGGAKPMYYELREYEMLPGNKKKTAGQFPERR